MRKLVVKCTDGVIYSGIAIADGDQYVKLKNVECLNLSFNCIPNYELVTKTYNGEVVFNVKNIIWQCYQE